jgi:hypothetical protein
MYLAKFFTINIFKNMKKIIILVGFVITGLAACTSPKVHTENIELVQKYVKAVEDMDFDVMDNYLDENYLGMGPSYGDSIGKTQAIENWKVNVETLYEKIHYNRSRFASVNIPDGDNKGDWVANWAELTINYKDGGSVTIWANSIYLIENGKIIRTITFYNEADALRQLGYTLVVPKE